MPTRRWHSGGRRCWPPSQSRCIGALIERLLLRRLYAAPELLQLTATFGVVLIVRDATLALFGAEDRLGPRVEGLDGVVQWFGRAIPQYDVFLLDRRSGGAGRADAADARARASACSSARRRKTACSRVRSASTSAKLFTAVFAFGAFLAGLAGALTLPREPANLGMDLAVIADAFVVTVVGGLGSIPGAFVAAIVIGVTKALCIAAGNVSIGGVTIAMPKITLVVEFIVMAVVLARTPLGTVRHAARRRRRRTTVPLERALIARPTRRHALARRRPGRSCRVVAARWRRVRARAGDRHPDRRAVRGKPALHFRHRRHHVVRSRRVFRHRRLRQRAGGGTPLPVRGSPRARAGRGERRGARVRLVLRAPVRHLPCDADARVRADRVVDRVAMGRGDRRIERHHRRLAAGCACRIGRDSITSCYARVAAGLVALVMHALTPFGYALRGSRDSPLRAAASGIDVRARSGSGARTRRRLRRPGRRPLRVFEGRHVAGRRSRFRARSMRS